MLQFSLLILTLCVVFAWSRKQAGQRFLSLMVLIGVIAVTSLVMALLSSSVISDPTVTSHTPQETEPVLFQEQGSWGASLREHLWRYSILSIMVWGLLCIGATVVRFIQMLLNPSAANTANT